MNGSINHDIRLYIIKSLEIECIRLFISAYFIAWEQKNYSIDWEEDTFTAHLYGFLDELRISKHWHIAPQFPIYNDDIVEGKKHANEAYRPDLKFEKYHTSGERPFEYYIEAKNICCSDWQKQSGANVSGSQKRGRYINTGISNFKNRCYPNGCLTGYIQQGEITEVIDKLNNLLTQRNRRDECLSKHHLINGVDFIYISYHKNKNDDIEIKHIFLDFT